MRLKINVDKNIRLYLGRLKWLYMQKVKVCEEGLEEEIHFNCLEFMVTAQGGEETWSET